MRNAAARVTDIGLRQRDRRLGAAIEIASGNIARSDHHVVGRNRRASRDRQLRGHERVAVTGHRGVRERDRLASQFLPSRLHGGTARAAPTKIRKAERGPPVPAELGPEKREKRRILRDTHQLPITQRPALRRKIEGYGHDHAQKWFHRIVPLNSPLRRGYGRTCSATTYNYVLCGYIDKLPKRELAMRARERCRWRPWPPGDCALRATALSAHFGKIPAIRAKD